MQEIPTGDWGCNMGKRYDAFISYSHKSDATFSKFMESVLEHFASPLPWRRRMRIFRDEADLAANPDLWASIEQALDASGCFILLASPEAASGTASSARSSGSRRSGAEEATTAPCRPTRPRGR